MNLAQVMQEIADQLDTIDGLTTHGFPAYRITPPSAVVTYPETYTYDSTYARGMDRMDLPVVVLVGKVDDRVSRDRIGGYADGSGARSVKQVVEAGDYTAFDSVRVTGVDFDIVTVAGDEYLSATFTLDIAGKGAV